MTWQILFLLMAIIALCLAFLAEPLGRQWVEAKKVVKSVARKFGRETRRKR